MTSWQLKVHDDTVLVQDWEVMTNMSSECLMNAAHMLGLHVRCGNMKYVLSPTTDPDPPYTHPDVELVPGKWLGLDN